MTLDQFTCPSAAVYESVATGDICVSTVIPHTARSGDRKYWVARHHPPFAPIEGEVSAWVVEKLITNGDWQRNFDMIPPAFGGQT